MAYSKYETLPEEIKKKITEFDSKYCNGEVFTVEYDNCEAYSDHFSSILNRYFTSYKRAVEYILNMEGLKFKSQMVTWREPAEIQFRAKYDDWSECSYSVIVLSPA